MCSGNIAANISFQTSQAEIEHEENLLNETAARESSLNTQVLNIEIELKQVKSENERLKAEKERVEEDFEAFMTTKEISAVEFKQLRQELRDLKYRETRMLTDYGELEEENIMLQKQISNLRSSQVNQYEIPCKKTINIFFINLFRSSSSLQSTK